jgi:hypothetical protein
MRRVVWAASFCIAFSLPFHSSGQSACMKDGQLCTLEEAKAAQERVCAAEAAPVNLTVAEPVKLTGVLLDDSGAPVEFERLIPGHRTIMQVRNARNGAILLSAQLEGGLFGFDQVPAGEFRLIAVSEKLGGFRRLPLTDQPRAMSCSGAAECHVEAVVHFHETDDPVDLCPPK